MCEAVIAVFVCVVQSVKQTVAERLRQLRHTRPVLAKFRTVLALPCLRLDRPKGLVNTVDDSLHRVNRRHRVCGHDTITVLWV